MRSWVEEEEQAKKDADEKAFVCVCEVAPREKREYERHWQQEPYLSFSLFSFRRLMEDG